MRLDELHKHYGTWTKLAKVLDQGMNSHQYWRRKGFIPFVSQLLIEHKTEGLFKASEDDCKPIIEE